MGEDGIRPSANHADAGCLGTWDKAMLMYMGIFVALYCSKP
jgi:hypothetical protein